MGPQCEKILPERQKSGDHDTRKQGDKDGSARIEAAQTVLRADGVIVSTPTGSTGYNLSAGGPIMDPTVHALVVTAIAPHTLSARTLVLRSDSEVHLTVGSRGDAVLSADGQTLFLAQSPRTMQAGLAFTF